MRCARAAAALNARALVLDADALNAIAADPQLQSLLEAAGAAARPPC
jgi:NAD(P)H-hydrate repair Nnr-like enzyme with NAD(P)H-hydrate dehydratase domain